MKAASFLDAPSLGFLKCSLIATSLRARRISEQQRSLGNIQHTEITETQLQIHLTIKSDRITFISLHKTWKKPCFWVMGYGHLRVAQLAVKFWNFYIFVGANSKPLTSNNKAMPKTLWLLYYKIGVLHFFFGLCVCFSFNFFIYFNFGNASTIWDIPTPLSKS